MSKFLTGGINLSKIPKDKITTAQNGDKWLNVVLWLNDEADQYGNVGSVQVSQSLEERDQKAPKTYLGNFKEPKKPEVPVVTIPEDDNLGLPF
jgi:hypothetical protein